MKSGTNTLPRRQADRLKPRKERRAVDRFRRTRGRGVSHTLPQDSVEPQKAARCRGRALDFESYFRRGIGVVEGGVIQHPTALRHAHNLRLLETTAMNGIKNGMPRGGHIEPARIARPGRDQTLVKA